MISIGLRATPTEIYYSIIETREPGKVNVKSASKLVIPVSLSFPEKLNYLRKTFKDIIFEYKAERAGIRITESSSPKKDPERISFEAVLQELLSSSSVKKYFVGQISNISSRIEIERAEFKPIVSGDSAFSQVERWKGYNKHQRESILVGLASLKS